MAIFTNVATLTYDGNTTTSNTVTGELVEVLTGTKTALRDTYNAGDSVTYAITLRNTGATALTGVAVTDNLGAYEIDGTTVYPLAYDATAVLFYVDGVLQPTPVVQAGPPLTVTGITLPAGSTGILIYEAEVTRFAPLDATDSITNEATVTGDGITTPVELTETVTAGARADLTVSKAISPAVVQENGQLTYTFTIQNTGNTPVAAGGDAVLTDTFNPILNPITVTADGVTWTAGINYTYNTATGVFSTLPGQIAVPAATYTRNADGSVNVVPGVTTVVVTGTV